MEYGALIDYIARRVRMDYLWVHLPPCGVATTHTLRGAAAIPTERVRVLYCESVKTRF